jgi:hypothetical protein
VSGSGVNPKLVASKKAPKKALPRYACSCGRSYGDTGRDKDDLYDHLDRNPKHRRV